MAEHPNALLIHSLLEAFRTGDLAAIEERLHPDCVWHFPGRRGALAGDHAGAEAVFGFLAKVVGLSNGTFKAEVHDVVAGDQHVVVLFTGTATRPDGRRLDNPTALVIRLEQGQAIEINEFVWDLDHVEDFWT